MISCGHATYSGDLGRRGDGGVFGVGGGHGIRRRFGSIALTGDGQAFADALGIDISELENQLNDELQDAFDILRLDSFLEAFSDAASFSNRGIGVDYAANTKGVLVGIAGNVAVGVSDSIENRDADQPARRGRPQPQLDAGGQYARAARPAAAHALCQRVPPQGELPATRCQHHQRRDPRQYKLFRGRDRHARNLFLLWGGLDITTGLEYSRLNLTLADTLETEMQADGTSGSAAVLLRSQGRYRMSVSALTVPFELTTNIRFLYLLSLYGGPASISSSAAATWTPTSAAPWSASTRRTAARSSSVPAKSRSTNRTGPPPAVCAGCSACS